MPPSHPLRTAALVAAACVLALSGAAAVTWQPVAQVDGLCYTSQAAFTTGSVGSCGDPTSFINACGSFPHTNDFVVKLTMINGDVVDYYRPNQARVAAGETITVCDLLTHYSDPAIYEWSKNVDGPFYEVPAYADGGNHLGGSYPAYGPDVPDADKPVDASGNVDNRNYVSFWGTDSFAGHRGGCCYDSYNGARSWQRAYTLEITGGAPTCDSDLTAYAPLFIRSLGVWATATCDQARFPGQDCAVPVFATDVSGSTVPYYAIPDGEFSGECAL